MSTIGIPEERPAESRAQVSRGEILAAITALAVLNACAPLITESLKLPSPLEILASGFGIDWIIWIALGVTFRLALATPTKPAGLGQIAVAGFCTLLILTPIADFGGLAATIMAVYVLRTEHESVGLRASAIVALGLSGLVLWAKLATRFFGAMFVDIDAWIVGRITHLPVTQNIISLAHGSGHLIVAQPCSSVHNVSYALLLFLAVTRAIRPRPRASEWRVAAAIFASVFVVNTIRLALMSQSMQDFHYWHGPVGATWVSAAMMAITIGWTVFEVRNDVAV